MKAPFGVTKDTTALQKSKKKRRKSQVPVTAATANHQVKKSTVAIPLT
jgi:hypothetical protein